MICAMPLRDAGLGTMTDETGEGHGSLVKRIGASVIGSDDVG